MRTNDTVKRIFLLLLLMPLSGCLLFAAGAGGGAGYYVAEEKKHPDGQAGEDDAISARVRDRFSQDPDIGPLKIQVDAYYGAVTVSGDVPSGAMAQRVIDLARGTPGVKSVHSDLNVH